MADRSQRDLLNEWQSAMQSVMRAVPGGDLAGRVMAPLQRQTELLQELFEAERRLQREVLGRALAPVEAAFDLLEQSGAAMRGQAEAMEHAAQALEQTAGLMKTQAELFERTVRTLREPTRLLGSAAGLDRGDGPPADTDG